MNVYDAIMQRRTIRKFTQQKIVKTDLIKLVDCARMAAYPANTQSLKFSIIDNEQLLADIFPYTKWAGAIENGTPAENERPTAYIAVMGDTSIKPNGMFEVEAGAAVTTIMLAAQELGLASCWLGAINRDAIKKTLDIDETLNVVYLLALGYPLQKSKAVEFDGDIKYFLDNNNVINVPKRSLNEVLVEIHK